MSDNTYTYHRSNGQSIGTVVPQSNDETIEQISKSEAQNVNPDPSIPIIDSKYVKYLNRKKLNAYMQETAPEGLQFIHKVKDDLPRDKYNEIAAYGVHNETAVCGPVNWDQIYTSWDQVGNEYREDIPKHLPLTASQMQSLASNGFIFEFKLGSGGFGTVWRVKACQLFVDSNNKYIEKQLACKVLSLRQFSQNQIRSVWDAVVELLRESDILKELIHHNIVKFEHVFHVMNRIGDFPQPIRLCLFMELCDGDLTSLIDSPPKHQLSESEAREWFVPIANALKYLHQNSVTHFDIKPHNILYKLGVNLTKIYKLTDFGIAKKFSDGVNTCSGIRGTPLYTAPEMRTNSDRYLSKTTDIYSLGITLAESISGRNRPGFPGSKLTFQMLLKACEQWTPQLGMRLKIGRQVADLLIKMTEEDPHFRITIEQICEHNWVRIL